MSNMWSNCFSFVLLTSRYPVFQNCKEILSAASCSLAGNDGFKQTLKLLVILHLTLFKYLSIIIADQYISFHGQVGNVIGKIYISLAKLSVCQSSQVIQMMCVRFRDCHMFTKILCSLCIEIAIPTLKYLANYTDLNSIFD